MGHYSDYYDMEAEKYVEYERKQARTALELVRQAWQEFRGPGDSSIKYHYEDLILHLEKYAKE
jgi:hypothetical protein